mgnify:CR=1 FL=1
MTTLLIRKSISSDLDSLLEVNKLAFGKEEGPEVVTLIKELLDDPTAQPLISLMALVNQNTAGHIIFSNAAISARQDIKAAILAPLAVHPDYQNRGIGGKLIQAGLKRLTEEGTGLVFVLGHPDYYPRHGFKPAFPYGFNPPHPIPEKHADAWMVLDLYTDVINPISGTVICANALNRREYW